VFNLFFNLDVRLDVTVSLNIPHPTWKEVGGCATNKAPSASTLRNKLSWKWCNREKSGSFQHCACAVPATS